ncbi:cupin domain-containing protein [Streptomyces sp. LP05-1]|uniref:Cupin domain-containing protein n=1 Tax=Streptomyces pyxinae TaxID=2970734 RepID=A0ABT2CLP5_9ACTN|nr:cupin domain-containing protein [Streptomyces sp. LP05-1]MCS0638353.1 cupin domain-containing protein [Streptomyces sp. LP05-1]
MHHRLVEALEAAFGWTGPAPLGGEFTRGRLTDPALPSRLLTPARLLDTVMRRGLSHPQFRAFQDGRELHPGEYFTDTVTRRGQGIRFVNMTRLSALMQDGATLVLDELDFFDPALEVACRALQWWSRELVQVNAYLTTQDAAGFALHWDDHDVVIVQIVGEKSWDVRGASRPVPMYRDAEPNNTPPESTIWRGTLRAGDVVHIPRGHWHQATRTDRGGGYSLHLTFGFVKRTGVNWLTWLTDQCRRDEVFRADLDRWGAPADQSQQEQQLTVALTRLAEDYPPSAFLAARERERPAARHVQTAGLFGPPAALVCVTDFRPLIEADDEQVRIIASGKQITVHAKAEPAVRLMLSGEPVDIERVGIETGIDGRELVGIFIREGLCAELTDELSSACTAWLRPARSSNTP